MWLSEMMAIDARGGQGGAEGEENYKRLQYDNHFARSGQEAPGATSPASAPGPHGQTQPEGMRPRPDMGNPDSRGAEPDKAQPKPGTENAQWRAGRAQADQPVSTQTVTK